VRPVKIVEWLQKYKISVVSMVPGVLRYLEKYLHEIKLPDLKFSFFSGDALYYDLAVKWKKCVSNGVIHNFYGPTETTIVCTFYPFDQKTALLESENGIVPLGKPFENIDYIVLNEDHQISERGELCISGPQVISGYLNGENENKFFVHRSKRYYRTGDIASVNSNGNLVFWGRVDHQVKIDGYRVELGEIEHALINIIKKDVAVVCLNDNGLNKLIAFVRSEQQTTKPITDKLLQILPEYMIPHKYIFLDHFPLNTNGKTDRKALLNSYI
jgi:acyl-coenzyme A synthetase/AMP-(fatty) acid ligase